MISKESRDLGKKVNNSPVGDAISNCASPGYFVVEKSGEFN
jgi:hypothetical protein